MSTRKRPRSRTVPHGCVVFVCASNDTMRKFVKDYRLDPAKYPVSPDGRHMALRCDLGLEGRQPFLSYNGIEVAAEGCDLDGFNMPADWPDAPSSLHAMLRAVRDQAANPKGLVEEIDEWDADAAPEGMPEESVSRLEELNGKFCAVASNGKYRIMTLQHEEGGPRWSQYARADFLATFENVRIERDMTGLSRNAASTIALGEAWQTWPGRRTAQGTCFDTKSPAGAIVDGRLNLWTGFGIVPKPDAPWDLFRTMILNDLCAGDEVMFAYVMRWLAWKIQNPGLLPEIAVAFRGGKGAGKTTLGEAMVRTFGMHGQSASNIDDILGRFNATRETKCFIYADEVVWGGDKKSEAELKKLITDRTADYEPKGLPSFQGVNHVALMIGGNDKWIVPASMDERRFCASTVSTEHFARADAPPDDPNRVYWNRIHSQLASGGLGGFLHAMQTMDLGDWHPREGVPQTAAMGEQKLMAFAGADKWWFECLRQGELPFAAVIGEPDEVDSASLWEVFPLALRPDAMVQAFAEWTARTNPYANVSHRALLDGLRQWGVEGGEGFKVNRVRCWRVPELATARKIMAGKLGFNPFGE